MKNILWKRQDTKTQVRGRSRTGSKLAGGKDKFVEERRHSTGAQEFVDDKRRMPRHVSYGGNGYEPNLKIKVAAGMFEKRHAKTYQDPEKRPRQPDQVFVTEKESDAMNWDKQIDQMEEDAKEYEKDKKKIVDKIWEKEQDKEDVNVRWEEERKVTQLDESEFEEEDLIEGKIRVNVSDLKELASGYQDMENKTERYKKEQEEYKEKLEELERVNKQQSGRLELIEAETEGNMKDIRWFQKKLMKAEKELEEMTTKYDTQMIIQEQMTKFFQQINPEAKGKKKTE